MAVGVMAEQRFIDVRSRRASMDSLLSQQRIHPLTVEIEPSRGKRDGLPTGLWLPSPLHSMLGPKKTLNLVGGAVAGQRRSRRPLRGPRRYSACTEEEMDSYPSLHPEEHCSLPSPTANISFLRLKSESNPKTVQGARSERTQLLISPDQRHTISWRTGKVVGEHSPQYQLKPPLRLLSMYVDDDDDEEDEEDSIVSSDDSDDDEDDDSEDPVQQFKQPLSAPQKSLPIASELKCLLSTTSPLISYNLKSLLSPSIFSSLPKLAQEQLVKLLPQADTLSAEKNCRSLDFAIQNEYFSQALQRWQDTLALGLLGRKQKVPSLSQAQKWKERYFEEHYGDMAKHTLSNREQAPVFYPVSQLSSYSTEQQAALDAIVIPPDQPQSPSLSAQLPSAQSCKTINVSLPKKPQVKRVRNHQIKLPVNDVCNAVVPKPTNNHCLSRLARDLTVSVPVEQFRQVVTGKRVLMEHSYSLPPRPVKQSPSLVLSVTQRCSCSTAPLRVCLHCHGMFHAFCSRSQSHCPLCIARTNS